MGSIAIGWVHWFHVAAVPGRTCYQTDTTCSCHTSVDASLGGIGPY